jgi:iduronate 2-sulfatase
VGEENRRAGLSESRIHRLGRAVRTERWRYAEWEDGGAMLFDRAKDPYELKNLAGDPAFAKTVEEMKELLQRLP